MYGFKDSPETKCVPPVPDLPSQIKKAQPKMYTPERIKETYVNTMQEKYDIMCVLE
jgi:hypothetical protein